MVNCGNDDTNTIGIDTLIGATLGVVIGNQIGSGSGRDAAKIIGGLGGGYIANQQRSNKQCKTYNQITRCEPIYEYVTEERVVGYRNCAEYNGQKICKETAGPLDTLTVTQKIVVH
ncbi:glycine zipper 2TM domain-containing protein [Arcobacter sp. FWKO B]|nr:glycine zipper 2TM domain-containing protein [Arcobacter sp. FWKO B]